jgi:hypothetical protein
MKQKLFISYSRRQTPFVDRLAEELENNDYSLWLDYKSLVLAQPWAQQIGEAVAGMDVFLLVISKDSMASKHVRSEWEKALELNKRIVLLIFEAVSVPEELQRREWVDLRVQYKQNFLHLIHVLENPGTMTTPVPQSGQKYPVLFWISIALSVVLAILCIPLWFTIIIPYLIFSLPWKIYKHNYVLSLLQPLLLVLPLINTFPSQWATPSQVSSFVNFLTDFSESVHIPLWIISWLLLIILHLPVMQRLGHPAAALVRFSKVLNIKRPEETPRTVLFAIDSAPEDKPYADLIRKRLEKLGHRLVAADEEPGAVFVLLSIYKDSTSYDPERQVVYPILLQDQSRVEESLSRIQWIDFRRGTRNVDTLGRLLSQPERLLKALGIAPMGNQRVYPFVINFLQYFYILVGVLSWGGILNTTIFLSGEILKTIDRPSINVIAGLLLSILSGIIQLGIVYLAVRGLRTRKGAGASLLSLLLLTIWQVVLLLGAFLALFDPTYTPDDRYLLAAGIVSFVLVQYYPYAFLLLIVVVVLQIRQLVVYLPRHQYKSFDRVERWFLLYTPPGLFAWVMQFMFHLILIFVFIILYLAPPFLTTNNATPSGILRCLWILLLLALFLVGLVNYLTKRSTRPRVQKDKATF